MTLAQRNHCFKGCIFLSSCSTFFILAVGGKLLPFYPQFCETALRRSMGIFQALAVRFWAPAAYAPFAVMFAAVLYALSVSILVLLYFEKTQTPEILFFGLFGLSFTFEIFRIIIPLQVFYPLPPVLLIVGTRILLFGRMFGIASLFVSSIYAAGFDIQKQGRVILAMVIALLVISLRIPVNGLSWDTSLTMIFAYSPMFRLFAAALAAITMINFTAAAYIRGTADYLFIALGALLVSLGRTLLLGSDTWITPLPALLMLAAGTWLITARLHRVYLWL